jgi:hypothetical protein
MTGTANRTGDARVTGDARIIASGAERMRRSRERRREGRICFLFELYPREISGLVELGWLPDSQRNDHAAVVNAFRRFIGYALDMTRNRGR